VPEQQTLPDSTSTSTSGDALADRPDGIVLAGVSRIFRTQGTEVPALVDVDLRLPGGAITALIGPSGCGKSTLLRLIGDLDTPTTGSVTVHGAPPSTLRRNGAIGVAFQDAALLPWRDVRGNIALTRQASGKKIDKSRITELIELVGLTGFERARPKQLSGGMRQRVALARALAVNPELLLLDEPFGALDELLRMTMNLELQRIWLQRLHTTVLVTHSISEAVFLADRVVVLAPRGGGVSAVVPVPFERPRQEQLTREPAFHELCDEISLLLAQASTGSSRSRERV
jgi:NitT/TauT family transport system ATP-binding protein